MKASGCMRKHDDMIKGGKVSVWIGDMNSEDELLAYVDDGGFGRDFDFVINPNDGRELVAKQHLALAITIALTQPPLPQMVSMLPLNGYMMPEAKKGKCSPLDILNGFS